LGPPTTTTTDGFSLSSTSTSLFDLRHPSTNNNKKKQLSLDDYGTFRVVNFIRSEVAAGRDPKPALAEAAAAGEKKEGKAAAAPWDDDAFLVPVNPEDPLLFYEYEEEEGNEAAAAEQTRESADPSIASSSLRAENEALRSALAALAAASLPPEAAAALPAPIVEALRGVGWGGGDGGDGEEEKPRGGSGGALLLKKGASSSSAKGNGTATPPSSSSQRKEQEVDDAYFDSYGGLGIHREMLSDEARTGAYRQALEENPSLIEDATVLDVGAGTGVLSLFAARAGAAAVVAVEASERVAALARQNAVANGFGPFVSSGNDDSTATTVTVVNARLEDIERLPGIGGSEGKEGGGGEESDEDRDRVDVLVSEWMGYALFFECMLDSVILARDRFLKKRGGAILPDRVRESFLFFLSSFFDFFSTFFVFRKSHSCFFLFPFSFHHKQPTNQATVSIAGVSPLASDLHFWDDVHGLDLGACAREARRHRDRHGAVVSVEPGHLVTTEARVHELDLLTCRVGDEAFSTAFELQVLEAGKKEGEEKGEKKNSSLGGIALWFDVEFSERVCRDKPVLLSTSPNAPQTHWHQALLELPGPMELLESGGGRALAVATVRGRISLSRGPCHRSVDVALEVQGLDSAGNAVPGTKHVGLYPFAMSE